MIILTRIFNYIIAKLQNTYPAFEIAILKLHHEYTAFEIVILKLHDEYAAFENSHPETSWRIRCV